MTDAEKTAEPSMPDIVRLRFHEVMKRHVGGEGLATIAESLHPRMTSMRLREIIRDDEEMSRLFNVVVESRAHHFIDRAAEIAADLAKLGDSAGMKAAADTYMKIAAKIAPKIYGEKSTVEVVGAGGGPVKHVVEMDPSEAYKAMLGGK